jgi:hypothetical protein
MAGSPMRNLEETGEHWGCTMTEGNLEKMVKSLEIVSYPVLEELKGIREELVKVNEQLRKVKNSMEAIEEKFRWARVGR